MKRVNYFAAVFGYVGWECFTKQDGSVMEQIIRHERYQMSKQLGEEVHYKIVEM